MDPNYELELCKKCEKAMEDAGVLGLTTEEMLEQKAEFTFDLALILMEDGHDVQRSSMRDRPESIFRLSDEKQFSSVHSTSEKQFVSVHQDKIVSQKSLTTADILADDWTIVKIASAL